jgi:hypothetical protein
MTNFKDITIRQQVSSRGGGVEVDLTNIVGYYCLMTAYQNYLGGGILGRISNSCIASDWEQDEQLVSIAEELRQYFHGLTNPESDWESMTFEENQSLPTSAY